MQDSRPATPCFALSLNQLAALRILSRPSSYADIHHDVYPLHATTPEIEVLFIYYPRFDACLRHHRLQIIAEFHSPPITLQLAFLAPSRSFTFDAAGKFLFTRFCHQPIAMPRIISPFRPADMLKHLSNDNAQCANAYSNIDFCAAQTSPTI